MTEKQDNSKEFDSTNFIFFLLKWRKPLIIICIIAAIVSAVVSLLIEEKFQSTVIMFPATTSSISKALLVENPTGKHDILEFGEEEQAEQLLQVLKSDAIRKKISDKFNLLKHYDIDKDDDYPQTKLLEEYKSNINFKRTEFQSVRIDVLDKSADTAALIANEIAMQLDTVMRKMQQERSVQALRLVETEYFALIDDLQALEDSLTKLRGLGVHEYEVQVEMITEQYSIALSKGNSKAANVLEEKLNLLGKYGGKYVTYRDAHEEETKRLSILRAKYKEAKVDAEQNIPHKFIVDNAYPAEKKAYPIRWLIVVVSTLAAFLLGILAIIATENYRRFKARD